MLGGTLAVELIDGTRWLIVFPPLVILFLVLLNGLFVDPVAEQIDAAADVGANCIELHTGDFALAELPSDRDHQACVLAESAEKARGLGLVAGGDEQPLPGIAKAERVEVVMRSKENGGRLVSWVGRVSVVRPDDEAWDEVTTALVADRLNLEDLTTVKDEWARRSVVVRIEPTGDLVEQPGALSDDAHNAQPVPTSATTRGALPRVLHRRQRRRPGLS